MIIASVLIAYVSGLGELTFTNVDPRQCARAQTLGSIAGDFVNPRTLQSEHGTLRVTCGREANVPPPPRRRR